MDWKDLEHKSACEGGQESSRSAFKGFGTTVVRCPRFIFVSSAYYVIL